MTAKPQVTNPAQAKARLKCDHPNWSIVRSDTGRWWGFLDMRLRKRDTDPSQIVDVEAESAEELDALLTEAES